jgi:hypothetical protein
MPSPIYKPQDWNRLYETAVYVILGAVLYGKETWSFMLRGQHKTRMLRRVYGSKRGTGTGWGKKKRSIMRNSVICSFCVAIA